LEIAMHRSSRIVVSALAFVLSGPLFAQQPAPKPVDKGLEEKVQVTMVQIEALVLDKDGKTVPGLTKDDFALKIDGKPVTISAVDTVCPIGATADPVPIKNDAKTVPAPIAPGTKRRIVLAFDYTFLDVTMRPQVLDAAAAMLRLAKTDDEEVMIVALASEVRVEQKFTKNVKQLVAALSRMKHDDTLWSRDFPLGSSGAGYFGNISTLMDVLGSYDGAKAVIFFSQAGLVSAAMRDAYYDDVVAHAAAGRAVIYPAKPEMLTASGGESLSRLANQTGGRMPFLTNDLSLPYRRAQRDLSCRYTVAAYLDPAATRDPKQMAVSLNKEGLFIRAPERVQLFSDEAKRQARARAAYIDPGPFERPLVRAFAFPAVPGSTKKWDTLLALNFPAPVGPTGADINVQAVLRSNNQKVNDYERKIHVDPAKAGETSRSVTVMGNTQLKAGPYDLTVVLAGSSGSDIVSAESSFVVPEVIGDLLILRGPIAGRVVPGGMFLRAKAKEDAAKTRIGAILGEGNGFEPLIVDEIDKQDKLLFYWSACVSGTNPLPSGVVVARTIVSATGETAHAYPPLPLALESRGKGVSCLDKLEELPPNTLASGDYRLDVTVSHANGDVVAHGTQPLTVR
jgi:VWFA-related protein